MPREKHAIPAQGEIAAVRGYMKQYEYSACEIYSLMHEARLDYISIADADAGILDDLVFVSEGIVHATQIKTENEPTSVLLNTHLISNALIVDLAASWRKLVGTHSKEAVRLRYIFGGNFGTSDKSLGDDGAETPIHSARFAGFVNRTNLDADELASSPWSKKFKELEGLSGLSEADFISFLNSLTLLDCRELERNKIQKLPASERPRAEQILDLLPKIVAEAKIGDQWTEDQLVSKLGWSIKLSHRRLHEFPVPEDFQENATTQERLFQAIREHSSGYISLLGPPGTGKSTLLQRALFASPDYGVARYLAFVPDQRHALGRAEAGEFLNDLTGALRNLGFSGSRFHSDMLSGLRTELFRQLEEASKRYAETGRKTVIVIDGLDHVPREETPTSSFIRELPPVQSIPEGVLIVLGSQHLELADLNASAKQQATRDDRRIEIEPLPRAAIHAIGQAAGLPDFVDNAALYEATAGHPLTARYFIEAIRTAPDRATVDRILSYTDGLGRELDEIYERVWNSLDPDKDAKRVLALIARAEGKIFAKSLARAVSDEAVEDVLKSAAFLLTVTEDGYLSIFHNSFRLFVGEQTNQRFGQPDTAVEKELNQTLAKLSSEAEDHDPQHWMELRYLARAGESDRVLELGTPEFFRKSLKAYRPYTEVITDLRLVYRAVGPTGDRTLLLNKLFAEKELDYRFEAVSQVDFVDVFLSLERRDLAVDHALSGESHASWPDLVDELWFDDEKTLARRVFEANEPLEALFANDGFDANQHLSEARDWIQRAHRFRPLESLISLIEALPIDLRISQDDEEQKAHIRELLLFSLARGILNDAPDTNVGELCDYLNLDDSCKQRLHLEMAEDLLNAGDSNASKDALEAAISLGSLQDLHSSWQMSAAYVAHKLGRTDIAKECIGALTIRPIMRKGGTYHGESLVDNCSDRYRLSVAAVAIGVNLKSETTSNEEPFFASLESKLDELAAIRGRIDQGDKSPASAEIKTIVYFLALAKPESSNGYLFHAAIDWFARAIVDIAKRLDDEEFATITSIVDENIGHGDNNLARSQSFRIRFALSVFDVDGDSQAALERLVEAQSLCGHEHTPHEAVTSKVEFAKALAHIGKHSEAWEALESIHEDTFGYFLRAKKEPQYEFWAGVFTGACAAKPENAGEYGKVFARFLLGMDDTEGYETARRVVEDLMIGTAAAPEALAGLIPRLIASDLTTWVEMASCVLAGISMSDSSLTRACSLAFSRLVVPYYDYQGRHFLKDAVSSMSLVDQQCVLDDMAIVIDRWCPPSRRQVLLEELLKAAPELSATLQPMIDRARKRAEELEPSQRKSSEGAESGISIDIEASSFDELIAHGEGKDRFGDGVDYSYSEAATKLVPGASKQTIEAFIAARPHVLNNAKFVVACSREMLRAGEKAFSDELFEQAEKAAQSGHWSWFLGGQKIALQELRIEREGDAARDQGFDVLVDELATGQTAGSSLFLNLSRVMELICTNIPYPEFWRETEAHLREYREFQFADPIEDADDVSSHADLLAQLLFLAYDFLCSDLISHARTAALEIAQAQGGGAVLASLLIKLERERSGPREAATLCYRLRGVAQLREEITEAARRYAVHPDYVVAHQGKLILKEFGLDDPDTPTGELPAFYALKFDDGGQAEDFDFAPGTAPGARSIWSDDPWTWTAGLGFAFRLISDASGIGIGQLRRRCAEFMRREGGREAFGPDAEEESVSRLKKMDLKMSYRRLLPMAAHRALGMVIGEILHACRLDPRVIPAIWSEIGGPSLMGWDLPVESKPYWMLAPEIPRSDRYGVEAEQWMEATSDALHNPVAEGQFILGEMSEYRYRIWPEMAESVRFCLPSQIDLTEVDQHLHGVPNLFSSTNYALPIQKMTARFSVTSPTTISGIWRSQC